MPSGKHRTKIVSGLHIVKKPLKLCTRYYVFAWRGGPCIHTQDDSYPVITQEILAKQQQVKAERYGESSDSLEQLIRDYKNSPEFKGLAERTQAEYTRLLGRISERFGSTPLMVFEARSMRFDIIEWKNQWASQPRTADSAAMMMNTLLGYGVQIGRLGVNIATNITTLHKVDRSDLIWEAEHWEAFKAAEPPDHLMEALELGSLTGFRLSDLVQVSWHHVGHKAIIFVTSKRKGRAVVPIIPSLRAWLDKTPPDQRVGTLLKNSRGDPWTSSGLGSVFQKAKPKGFDRTIHDLRGTFVTFLINQGLTDDQVAMVVGWTAKRISQVRARYVNEERIILNLAERLSA